MREGNINSQNFHYIYIILGQNEEETNKNVALAHLTRNLKLKH